MVSFDFTTPQNIDITPRRRSVSANAQEGAGEDVQEDDREDAQENWCGATYAQEDCDDMEDDQEHDEGCEPKNGTTHDSGVADAMASWLQQLQDRARLSPARASVGTRIDSVRLHRVERTPHDVVSPGIGGDQDEYSTLTS
ncbi:unnamed protein product [Phytophthora fragariaefolia]|uniref:Unnamed protein product n=1 Tax=Phytophthora fragariaefolia TaxID=1490495 RepID=A0A9W6YAW0_9STRA|nr:unnamed protein product [Phytophthora fragariaefolia]